MSTALLPSSALLSITKCPRNERRSSRLRSKLITSSLNTNASSTISEISLQTGIRRTVHLDGKNVNQPLSAEPITSFDNPVSSLISLAPLKQLFLPRGWPDSVSKDYINYQLYTFPAHITGWMSSALAGSSMLKALGISMGPAGTVGFSAAIKWVTKDGLGAVGRMVVGGGLSSKFDEDPRRWRMLAELVTTTGLSLEIATQVYPVNFILLAGTGNLCKAIGKGMGRPCFRVIQTHFSATNNVGDVAAKEEVWEVAAQLIGLAASVGLLTAVEAMGIPEAVVPLWATIHSMHVALRYYSLKKLEFPYPNMKRACVLVNASVRGQPLKGVAEVNREEPVWSGPASCSPAMILGCPIDDTIAAAAVGIDLNILLDVYKREKYILTVDVVSGVAHVSLWEDAQPVDLMRAVWQAAWLVQHSKGDYTVETLRESVEALEREFQGFYRQAVALGWNLERTVMPAGPLRLCRGQLP